VQHDEVVVADVLGHLREFDAVARRIDQLRILDQGGGLREPGRIPERAHFAPRLVARAGTAVEAVERRRLKKQCSHHGPNPAYHAII